MSDVATSRRVLGPSGVEVAFSWFQRIVAVYCLLFGVLYWVRLVGFYPGPLWRFDLMPIHWQVAAVTLAVLFPIAAAGLWMLASWGPVIWFICAATETAMYGGFSPLFGERLPIVAAHAVVALLYIAFRIVLHWRKRQALQ
ncbi:DUF6163 family protein [Ollibium composti]|uniref:Permeases of the major facilitator superfamily n=1 Tax=Ollibium composti TaxID=2675109 RepID=A0ABY2QCC9_9HYPH|nr:DUF6163 family protein [Mesorhizobium composti]THF59806.1 hypothetical protein E6C48_01785 [Mesorhizobium composti]